MKLVSLTIISALCATTIACSRFESHFRVQGIGARPNRILIGYFERRSLKFNPYVDKNFRDSLRFEFFKRGYQPSMLVIEEDEPVQVINTEKPKTGDDASGVTEQISTTIVRKRAPRFAVQELGKEKVAEFCRKNNAELYLHGAISEIETGDFIDKKTSTFIEVLIFNASGDMIGEAHYRSSRALADAGTLTAIAHRFVDTISNKMPRR